MTIEKGFNDKPTHIRINGRIVESGDPTVEMWIEQTGVEGSRETLSYLTLDELGSLLKETRQAMKDAIGL